jgi:hypothetical protein
LGQDIKLPPELDKRLAEKATEVVDVTLDGPMLNVGARFLSNRDPEQARVKQLVTGLKGIYVRSYQFDKENEYSASDVEAIRNQLKKPEWSRMVGVTSRKSGENAEVYLRMEGDKTTGLAVIAAEPRELTVVNISGPIDPEQLSELGGHFGVPKVKTKKIVPKD